MMKAVFYSTRPFGSCALVAEKQEDAQRVVLYADNKDAASYVHLWLYTASKPQFVTTEDRVMSEMSISV